MKVLNIKVTGQSIVWENPFPIVEGSKEYLYCDFEFSEDWSELSPAYRFYNYNAQVCIDAVENIDGKVLIPSDVLEKRRFFVAVGGYSEDGAYVPTAALRIPLEENGYGKSAEEDVENDQNASGILGAILELSYSSRDAVVAYVAAENSRVDAENKRVFNEEERTVNEQSRAEAETLRESAEKAREKTEEDRIAVFSGMRRVQEHYKETFPKFVPIIGENGNWFVFDYDAAEYKDSGVRAYGKDGAQGEQGLQGEKGDTGSQGPQGEVGPQGEKGIAGAAGADGKSAYEIACDEGFDGTKEEWLASLKGDKGVNISTDLYTANKNILDSSKIIRSGDGNVNATTGEIEDGSYYVYGKYDLTVGETYTLSKPSAPVWLYFYNNDESYAGYGTNKGIGVTETSKTFEAEYPKVLVMSQKEITSIMVQLELGDSATEYSDYGVTLKDSVRIPIVGKGQLETEADNLVDAVNEVNEKAKNVPEIEGDVTELKKQQVKIGQLCTVGKNMLDLSKIIRSGDGAIDAKTGEVIDGSYYVYGKYDLDVGESYTISKTTGNAVWLYFYNADGSYVVVETVFSIGATATEKTFEATYPLVVVVSMKEPTAYNVQIELGETKTEYEQHCVKLNENVEIPIVGDDELNTEAKTLIGAVNELKESADDIPVLKTDINESKDDIFEIKKALPRLNEEITGWTLEFFGADGNLIASNTTWYSSNKILLLAGKTYNILGAYLGYTVYYDLDGNFLGRGTDCESITTVAKNNYEGTVTVGESDVYAVLQTIPSKLETAYISRYVGEKASTDICEKLLVNKNLMDKKVLIFGDSITTGDTSAKVHAGEKYGNYNKWVEALIEDKYFAEYNVRNDSIHATGFVARFNGEDDLITRLRNTKDTDYDLVIVFAGINDSLRANSIEVGFGMDEQGNKETDILKYFVPAVDTFFAELVEKFVDARICVVLPLRTRYSYAGHGATAPVTLADGSTSKLETDYADYIAKVAAEYCLPVLDATRQSGFAPFNTTFGARWVNYAERGGGDTTLVPDGVHPNEEYCKKYLSKYIRGFIDGLI